MQADEIIKTRNKLLQVGIILTRMSFAGRLKNLWHRLIDYDDGDDGDDGDDVHDDDDDDDGDDDDDDGDDDDEVNW